MSIEKDYIEKLINEYLSYIEKAHAYNDTGRSYIKGEINGVKGCLTIIRCNRVDL